MSTGFEGSQYYGPPLHTSTTITATGATNLVGAPAAGSAIAVDAVRYIFLTDTSSRTDVYLSPAATATSIARVYTTQTATVADVGAMIQVDFNSPVLLPSATALQVMLTQAAASTPGMSVEVEYRIYTR